MIEKEFEIIIDGQKCQAKKGQTILQIAKQNNIDIPALCYHPDLCVKANCRLCVVQIKGRNGLHASCSIVAEPGMEIETHTHEIYQVRQDNLEFLIGQHKIECDDCLLKLRCPLLNYAKKYRAKLTRFPNRKVGKREYDFGPAIHFDPAKCIDCRNCVEMCEKQCVKFFDVGKNEDFWEVVPTKDPKRDCIYCGQCITHCPVGALEAVGEYEQTAKPLELLKEGKKHVVVGFAPAIRASIGELFDLPHGTIATGQLIHALKKLGFKDAFDVSSAADITTIEEADEVIARVKENKPLPMMSSCCPAWVKWLEFFAPEWLPYLTTARSPQIMLGGLLKTYWAKKNNIKPEDIYLVSIMPCTAKKYEATRPELALDGLKPVDQVWTTRELAWILKKNKIDLRKMPSSEPCTTLCTPSGAGVIYGKSGGVTESAMRTIFEKLTQKPLQNFKFEPHKNIKYAFVAQAQAGDLTLRVVAVSTMEAAKKILEEIKQKPNYYHYLEVMACPDGCIGGGGQPMPVDENIRHLRANALKKIDESKPVRAAHLNPEVAGIYKEFLHDRHVAHKILHTKYQPKKKENNF